MLNNSIGKKVKEYRKRAGFSQFNLELEIGAASGSISRIEKGLNNPTKETIIKIAEALKLTPLEIAALFGINLVNLPQLNKTDNNKRSILHAHAESFENFRKADIKYIIDNLLSELESQFNAKSSTFYFYHEKRKILELVNTTSVIKDYEELNNILNANLIGTEVGVKKDSFIAEVLIKKETMLIDRLFELIVYIDNEVFGVQKRTDTKTMVIAPVIFEDKVLGILTFQLAKDHVDKSRLNNLIDTASRAIKLAKARYDYKYKPSWIEKSKKMFSNALNLIKRQGYFFIAVVLFLALTCIWLFNQIFNNPGDFWYDKFAQFYFIIALIGFLIGLKIFFKKRILDSLLKSSLGFIILGLFGQIVGQAAYSVTWILTGNYAPYPSLGDIGYIASAICILISVLSFLIFVKSKAGIKYEYSKFDRLIFLLIYSIPLLININTYERLDIALWFDLLYIVLQGTTTYIAYLILKLVFNIKSTPIVFASWSLILSSIFLYIADNFYTFQLNNYQYTPGNISDYLYVVTYFFLIMSLIKISSVSNIYVSKAEVERFRIQIYQINMENIFIELANFLNTSIKLINKQ